MARAIKKRSSVQKAKRRDLEKTLAKQHIGFSDAIVGGEDDSVMSKSQAMKQTTKVKKDIEKRLVELRQLKTKLKKNDPMEKAERKRVQALIKQLTDQRRNAVAAARTSNDAPDDVTALMDSFGLDAAAPSKDGVNVGDGLVMDKETGRVSAQ